MIPPDSVKRLVDKFDKNKDQYLLPAYNEAQLRLEFLDPFFAALGWDIENKAGLAEPYKEVVVEGSLRIGSETKAPDYDFRVGSERKFFVEAKKPAVNIKEDATPAFQLRRYAWSAKLPLSILSDFQEFAVYDCRIKPAKTDKASSARVNLLSYQDYVEKWEHIYSIFSRDAVWHGSFDKYAIGVKGKKGTDEVDDAFLKEIEGWRDVLARNIALRNPKLSVRELNFAVQRTIDRIIFLRICEDRGIEGYGTLKELVDGDRIYKRMCDLYYRADEKYNSGLFHFRSEKGRPEIPDGLTPGLHIDDKPLKDIIGGLYYPDCSYEFSVLPADILGQVYEQFLGKVIRLTAGHQAKVEEKPEVKKAGGVYYTPTYIVDYIVKNTVGKLVEGKDPKQVAQLRILDPACGSGSFLIGAYQCLLDWHRDWFTKDDPKKWSAGKNATLYRGPVGDWRLTTAERKRILLNNIFGVDIDSQAVEVTKLSLLLKVLEGESDHSISQQLKMFHERALPDLGGNIKCGNSLIGPDFFDGNLVVDQDERHRVNALDWGAEFKKTMDSGGFDVVIGNPPYVRQEELSSFKVYWRTHYNSYNSTADLYVYFIERGISLLHDEGVFGIIVSSSFMRTTYAKPLRRYLQASCAVSQIVDFGGLSLFANAKDIYVCILFLTKHEKVEHTRICRVPSLDFSNLHTYVCDHEYMVPLSRLREDGWSLEDERTDRIFNKLKSVGVPLGQYTQGRIYYGLKTGLNTAFEIDRDTRIKIINGSPKSRKLIKPFLGGQDIRRYYLRERRHLIVIPSGWTSNQMRVAAGNGNVSEREAWGWFSTEYGSLAQHLEQFEEAARNRQDKGEFWWELRPCDYYSVLDGPKIVYPDIAKHPRFCLDKAGIYIANTAYCLGTDDLYLLGILNSALAWFAIARVSIPFGTRAGQSRYRLIYQYMEKLPIRRVDLSSPNDVDHHARMVALVESMLRFHKALFEAKTDYEMQVTQRQIDSIDKKIDTLVYELYGLTGEEITIIEKATETRPAEEQAGGRLQVNDE